MSGDLAPADHHGQLTTLPRGGAAVVLVAVLGLAVGMATRHPPAAAALATEPGFTISSSITDFPDCREPAPLLPGVERCLTYTVANALAVPITVTSIGITDIADPPRCPASNLDLSHTTYTGSFDVAAGGSASSPGLPISLVETGRNQDSCQGATFVFAYAGTATGSTGEVLGGTGDEVADAGPRREDTGRRPFPVTGGEVGLLVVMALAALVVGGVVLSAARRRGSRPRSAVNARTTDGTPTP